MEDQKKTDVIKNVRTVLPPLNLKASDTPEEPAQKSAQTQAPPSPQLSHGRIPPAVDPAHMPNMPHQGMMHYGYRPQKRERERERPPQMHMPPSEGRYRVHPTGGYMPYNPYGKSPLGYPPGRHPPHNQTRYYPPSRHYPYMGEMHHPRAPAEKKPPMPQHTRHAPSTILMPEIGGSAKVQIKDAMRYLDVVKEEYKSNKEVYNKFLKTMKDYKDRRIDAKKVIEIMLNLFDGNQKLIQGFNQFLPKKYEILPSGEVKVHETEREPRKTDEREIRQKEEYAGGNKHQQGSYDPRRDLEGLGIGIKTQGVRTDSDSTGRVVNYLNKVRKHLENNPVAWFEFLRIVQSYKNSREQKPISEILASIKVLLKDDPILISEFMVFLPSSDIRNGRPLQRHIPPNHGQSDSLAMLHDIRSILSRKGVYKEFVKALNMFNQGLLNTNALLLVIEPFLRGAPTLFSLFRYYIGHREINAPPHIQNSLETYQKIGSYRILPEKYRKSTHSGQSASDASVLNTSYVACPTFTSESSTFIFAKKNAHEEALYRVEDERYEWDVLLERVSALILRLMEYEIIAIEDANVTKDNQRDKAPLEALKLTALDKEIISVVYGSACDDIILGIIAHPIRAIPVVLKQIRSVETQWIKSRTGNMETWRGIVGRNYMKSLDVRGYKIRSTEKKTSLVKQYIKDLDSTSDVHFPMESKRICSEVFDILVSGMGTDNEEHEEEEEEEDKSANISSKKYLSLILSLVMREGVFLITPEIYCVLRGLCMLSKKVLEALSGKKIKPASNKIAEELGLHEDMPVMEEEKVLEMLRAYVLGEMEGSAFEEKILGSLGVCGASLVGLLGTFQSVESMLDTVLENKGSLEMLDRLSNREEIQRSNVSELIIRGVSIVKATVREVGEGKYEIVASRLTQAHTTSTNWINYVKNYNSRTAQEDTKEEEVKAPFLHRSLKKRKADEVDATFGMESLFTEGKFKVRHIPGTEDFVAKKKQKISEVNEEIRK